MEFREKVKVVQQKCARVWLHKDRWEKLCLSDLIMSCCLFVVTDN